MPANAGLTWKRQFGRQTTLPLSASYKTEPSSYTGPLYVVQSATNGVTTGDVAPTPVPSSSIVLPRNTTPGNCLVLCLIKYYTSVSPVVSLGGSGDNWSETISLTNAVFIYTDQNCAGGQNTVTINFTQTGATFNPWWATVYEVAGVASTNAVDKTAQASQASLNWSSGATSVTSQQSEIAFGVSFNSGPITGISGAWVNTAISEWFPLENWYAVSGYQVLTGRSAIQYSGTGSSAGGIQTELITLKAANPGANVVGQPEIRPGRTWRRRYHPKQMNHNTPNSVPNPSGGGASYYDDFFLMYG
jgi:hypothetical protein